MNKKIIVTIIGICFIIMGTTSSLAISIEKKTASETQESLTKTKVSDENETLILFQAVGPVRKITEFEFLSGSEAQIQRINEMMSKRFFYPIKSSVFVKNLTFKITFTRLVKLRSRNWYASVYAKFDTNLSNVNDSNITSIMNKPHSYIVKNFTGTFKFIQPKFFRFFCIGPRFFRPYRFIITGFCENISESIVVT